MATLEEERDTSRATVATMRRRKTAMHSCCGFDPTLTDVEVSPRARRTARIAVIVVVFAVVVLAVSLLA